MSLWTDTFTCENRCLCAKRNVYILYKERTFACNELTFAGKKHICEKTRVSANRHVSMPNRNVCKRKGMYMCKKKHVLAKRDVPSWKETCICDKRRIYAERDIFEEKWMWSSRPKGSSVQIWSYSFDSIWYGSQKQSFDAFQWGKWQAGPTVPKCRLHLTLIYIRSRRRNGTLRHIRHVLCLCAKRNVYILYKERTFACKELTFAGKKHICEKTRVSANGTLRHIRHVLSAWIAQAFVFEVWEKRFQLWGLWFKKL